MDSLRALMLIGGVFYHAALPYCVIEPWIVRDPSGHVFFDYLSSFLHAFRMPTFFFVSGFFCAMGFSRRALNQNLKRRLVVFGVPMLTVMILIQPVEYLLRFENGGAAHQSARSFFVSFFSTGDYIGHLWFLLNLIFYYVAIWVFLKISKEHRFERVSRSLGSLVQKDLVAKVVFSKTFMALISCILTLAVNHFIGVEILPGISIQTVVLFFPFFLIGYICFTQTGLFENIIRIRAFDFIVLILLYAVKQLVHIENHYATLFFEWMLWYQVAWTIGMLSVYLSKRFLDIESRLMRKIADAGYSIYLLHQIIVVALVTLFVGTPIPGGYATKYVVVVAGTLALTFLLHHGLIARYRVTRVLFNGRLDGPAGKIRSGSRSPSTAT